MENNYSELYRKHRPTMLKQVVGQKPAIDVILGHLKQGFPHTLLLYGVSGVGKSTIARILRRKLQKLTPDENDGFDFEEVNCASVEGAIDKIRDIESRMRLLPMFCPCRVWVFEEIQSFSRTPMAMQAMLRMLEDMPSHVYFILATTDKDKLLPAILTRCVQIELLPLSQESLLQVLNDVLFKEGKNISEKVKKKICENVGGSARAAVVLLGTVLGLEKEEDQLQVIQPAHLESAAFDLVKLLLWEKGEVTWKEVADLISSLPDTDNWEGLRQLMLTCATKELLKNNKNQFRAHMILDVFQFDWFATRKAGLVRACYEVCCLRK